jgi:hypothetical protein
MFFIGLLMFPQTGIFADYLYISLTLPVGNFKESEIVTWDEERSSEGKIWGGGAAPLFMY